MNKDKTSNKTKLIRNNDLRFSRVKNKTEHDIIGNIHCVYRRVNFWRKNNLHIIRHNTYINHIYMQILKLSQRGYLLD